MLPRLFIKLAVAALFMASIGAGQILAQGSKPPAIARAVYWSDAQSRIEVYLVQKEGATYRLAVLSPTELKVIYHTRINSIEPVEKELAPLQSLTASVRYYEFEHHFTKMTIWMGIEFKLDGKSLTGLTRTFYDDIFTPVPENFFPGAKKEKQ